MLQFLLLCCIWIAHTAGTITIHYIGSDGDWNNASNWDLGVVPSNSSFVVVLSSGSSLYLPSTSTFGSLSVTDGTLFVASNASFEGTIELNDQALYISAPLSGNGSITDGYLFLNNTALVTVPLNSPYHVSLDPSTYIHSLNVETHSCVISGGSWGEPSVDTLFLSDRLGSLPSVGSNNLTVRHLHWSGYNIFDNLMVTDSALLDGLTHYLFSHLLFSNSCTVNWDDGHIYLQAYTTLLDFQGPLICTNKSSSCYFDAYSTSASSVVRFYSVVDAREAISTYMYMYSGKFYSYGEWLGNVWMNWAVNFHVGEGSVFDESQLFCHGSMYVESAVVIPYLQVYVGASLEVFEENTKIMNITLDGGNMIVHSNITMDRVAVTDVTNFKGETFFILTSLDLSSVLKLYNSSLMIEPNAMVTSSSASLYLYGASYLFNFGYWTINSGISFSIDSPSVFANFGTLYHADSSNLNVVETQTGSEGGQWINGGLIHTTSNTYYIFQNNVPFYQCDEGTFQFETNNYAQLRISDSSVINGILLFVYPTKGNFDSDDDIALGYWTSRDVGGVYSPLLGNASVYTQIAGVTSPLLATACQDISGTTTYLTFYHSNTAPASLSSCAHFVSAGESNGYCALSPYNKSEGTYTNDTGTNTTAGQPAGSNSSGPEQPAAFSPANASTGGNGTTEQPAVEEPPPAANPPVHPTAPPSGGHRESLSNAVVFVCLVLIVTMVSEI